MLMSMCLRIACVFVQLLACASAPSCGTGYGGLYPAADKCERTLALITWKPALASAVTRADAGMGSTPRPVYNALGGPTGKGHVAFDGALSQYLNSGPRSFNVSTNGGFTFVAVVRFRAHINEWNVLFHAYFENPAYPSLIIYQLVYENQNNIGVIFRGYDVGYNWALISTQFINITVTMVKSTITIKANGITTVQNIPENLQINVQDTTISSAVVGGFNTAFFNGDIAGLIFVDELLSSAAIAQAYSNIVQGVDVTTCSLANPCTACLAGKYKNGTGTAYCADCPAGKYSNVTAPTCTVCAAGKYSNDTAIASCLNCGAGTYAAAATAATACTSCVAGKASAVSLATAAATCVDCVAGKYASTSASTTCVDCAPGTYAVAPAALACAQCRSNAHYTTSSITISTGILCDCNPGYFDQTCADSSIEDSPYCYSSQFTCLGLGQFNCWYCCGRCTKEGTDCLLYGIGTPRTCVACPAGKYDSATSIWTCIDCPANSWSAPAGATPDACVCNAGFTGPNANACTSCDAGKYKNVIGTTPCTSCPDNSNAGPTSTAITACTCNVGFTGPDGGVCTSCAAGTYKDSTGSAACTCNAGFTDPAGTTCTACALGKYKDAPGSAACVVCPDNSNSGVASPSLASCICNVGFEGLYADACTPCAAGHYKNTVGNDYCLDCVPGSWSDTGATACLSCPAYSTSPAASPSVASCMCNAGYYGANAGVCSACAAGKYKGTAGNVNCVDCVAGWSAAGASVCTACPASSASPPASQAITSCTCNVGYTGTAGICAACAAGKYKDTVGFAACSQCTVNRGASCVACTLARACTCNAGYIGGNFFEPFTTTACARFVALIIQRPAFASVATRNNATIGSASLPTYDLNGGPNGYGHLSFDRALAQSVAYGPRTFSVQTNGGFTIVAVFRVGVEYMYKYQVLLDATFYIGPDRPLITPDAFVINAQYTSSNDLYIIFYLEAPGWTRALLVSPPIAFSDDWVSVVVSYAMSTNVASMSVNGNPPFMQSGCLPFQRCAVGEYILGEEKVPDMLLDRITVGNLYTYSQDYLFYNRSIGPFHGDVAGLFVVDEALSTDATTAIYENMLVGYDFTIANCTPSATCTACAAGKYKTANGTAPCLNCRTGTVSTVASQTCPDCPAGSYSTAESVYCRRCVVFSTSPIGSGNISACSCFAGYGGDAVNGTCKKCAAATYKPKAGNALCTACPLYSGANCSGCQVLSQCLCNYFTVKGENRTLPASGCLDPRCYAGYYGPDGGPCLPCAAGKYKATSGSACTACPAGTYQNRTASTVCAICHNFASSPVASVSASNCTCNPGYTRVS